MKGFDYLYRFSLFAGVIFTCAMMGCVIIQIGGRLFLSSAPSWTEELSRMFFIYAVAFGLGCSFKNGALIKLEILDRFASKNTIWVIDLVINIALALFGILMMGYAVPFVLSGSNETSPALQVPMYTTFTGILILFFFVMVFSLEAVYDQIKRRS